MHDKHHQATEKMIHMPLPEAAHSHQSWQKKLTHLAITAGLLGNPHIDGALGPNPAAEVQPARQTDDEALSDKEDRPFDIEAAYRASEAKLDTAAEPLVMTPLSKKDEERMASIEEKINAKELNKGSWFESLEGAKHFYKGVLSPSEINFYYEKWPLSYDRSMVELNRIEATLEANNARFIGVVRTSSGIGYNIYEASTDDEHKPPEIDAKALDVVTSLLISELSSLDQSVLPQAEIERLQTLARAGKLNTVSVNMIIADKIDACVIPTDETNILRQVVPGEECDAIGLHIDSSELQDADTTSYRNLLILIGRSSGYGPVLSTENNTVAHEIIHALMAMSTLTYEQRSVGSPEEDPWEREHNQVVNPLISRLEGLAIHQGITRKHLQIIQSDASNDAIQEGNGRELRIADGEVRTPKQIANNIEHNKGRDLEFASVTIVEQLSSAGKQLNITRTYDYPVVEGYDGGGWDQLVNPGHDVKFFSVMPGPGDKPVVKEIKFDPKTMSVMPIQVGGKGAEILTFTGELHSSEQSNEYLLTHTDELAISGVTPVATERTNLPGPHSDKDGGE